MNNMFKTSIDEITRLILVRHGETKYNANARIDGRSDTHLNQDGRLQAKLVSKRLMEYEVDTLYVSPLIRAIETAEIIKEFLGIEMKINENLIEYDFGDISGLTLDEIKESKTDLHNEIIRWLTSFQSKDIKRPNVIKAETMKTFKDRLIKFEEMVIEKHHGKVVLAVTHGGAIRALLTILAGGTLNTKLPFWVDNASITVIDFYKGAASIRIVNERWYIDKGKVSYGKPLFL